MDAKEIEKRVAAHENWFHVIELPHGIKTPGTASNEIKVPILNDLGLPTDLAGKRALDIGCMDGAFSFEMERRGAEVMAMDLGPKEGNKFETARQILGSSVEYRSDNVYNLAPERHGTFDVVLFLGVIYHLRQPLTALDRIRTIVRDDGLLFVGSTILDTLMVRPDGTETGLRATHPDLSKVPLWQFHPRDSLKREYTNLFVPNLRALETAVEEAQFRVLRSGIIKSGGYLCATPVNDAELEHWRLHDQKWT